VLTHIPKHSEHIPTTQVARLLKRRAADSGRFTTPHDIDFKADSEVLSSAFSRRPSADCVIWQAEMPPHFSFTAYEDASDRFFFGVIKAIDARKVRPSDT
jgi:hypothetical protein